MHSLLSLVNEGRHGDNTLRTINGELSHVNSLEAGIIDKYGGAGEQVVSEIGSGTINPDTGLREYFDWFEREEGGWNAWRPAQGSWGLFGETEAAKKARKAAQRKEAITKSFDENIGEFREMNFADMTQAQRKAAVQNLVGEHGGADDEAMGRYFSEYDRTAEHEAYKGAGEEMKQFGEQADASLLELYQNKASQEARSGFASTGNPMVDQQRKDIFSSTDSARKSQWANLMNEKRGLQDEYNESMLSNAFAFEEALTS